MKQSESFQGKFLEESLQVPLTPNDLAVQASANETISFSCPIVLSKAEIWIEYSYDLVYNPIWFLLAQGKSLGS